LKLKSGAVQIDSAAFLTLAARIGEVCDRVACGAIYPSRESKNSATRDLRQ
jgi:hypothetical protein